MDLHEKRIKLEDVDMLAILGYNDGHLHLIEKKFHSIITVRGNSLIVRGEPEEIKAIETIFNELVYILKRNGSVDERDVNTVLELLDSNPQARVQSINADNNIIYYGVKEPIKARTARQIDYCKKVLENDLVFAIGPAGTGKTYLAVAMALSALKRNEVSKIILSRPAVEAGESLGFLPGDLREKLDPYIKPLTDALFDMIPADKLKNYMEKNIIEIIPLAYMRGRTLSNSFIILDEAQNATITQMKMFLTRMGHHSKAIVTGDVTQIDLLNKKESGLINARKILTNIPSIEFIYFDNKDVVRHKLVADIIKAYEKEEKKKEDK